MVRTVLLNVEKKGEVYGLLSFPDPQYEYVYAEVYFAFSCKMYYQMSGLHRMPNTDRKCYKSSDRLLACPLTASSPFP